ncbi:MAG: metal/formaldehyde-sensitive transcriptional repressor [Devosia sp.]|jgi:DNA-binding FrmR family transcriptional regulator|uniref:metal/formaldehyde-sensitive transcriptional repressor n=1 Tax=unclassified Devosia TaxID=196773 RepID=UPI00092A1359|nr:MULTISPECIES: metal/formaldehyde-sensitive transcriptional repressor [unclassified Devosia]MBL8598858.1 metal/formaldehyde-sensitive transcriptional repressor [Devosia sp.]MBN9344723.1 metal/formaldehyde-sensitive transcriptional repressor [Devosia sp.]OJX51689.1 MAG: transcriptional regulator [Devosia sp. 66-22]
MSHTTKHKAKLLARVRRMKGQLVALETALEGGTDHADLLNIVASVRGAMNGLTAELIELHIREHVANPDSDSDPRRAEGAAELIDIVRMYLK